MSVFDFTQRLVIFLILRGAGPPEHRIEIFLIVVLGKCKLIDDIWVIVHLVGPVCDFEKKWNEPHK